LSYNETLREFAGNTDVDVFQKSRCSTHRTVLENKLRLAPSIEGQSLERKYEAVKAQKMARPRRPRGEGDFNILIQLSGGIAAALSAPSASPAP